MYITSQAIEAIVNNAGRHANNATGELSNESRNSYLWCVAYAGFLADSIMEHSYADWQNVYDAIAQRCNHLGIVAEMTNALLRHGMKRWHNSKAFRPSLKLKKSWRKVKASTV